MSVSRWVIAVAFGLALAGNSNAQKNVAEPEVEPQPTQEKPADQPTIEPTPVEPTVTAPTNEASSEHDQSSAPDSGEEPKQAGYLIFGDTWAQWAMAATGVLALIVSAWAVWLLNRTLQATRAAVRSADEAVEVTREVARDQSRAYLDAEKALFFWGGEGGERQPRVEVFLRNSGQTPAKWYEVRAKEMVFEFGDWKFTEALLKETLSMVEFSGPWVNLAPRESGRRHTVFCQPEIDEIEKALKIPFNRNSHGFAVFGEIRYCSQFDEIFTVPFCFSRHSLKEYRIEETVSEDWRGITINRNYEAPIELGRQSLASEAYVRAKQ